MNSFENQIQIVLSHTTHPGNIGAAARAMKVMGLSRLVIINPKQFPCAEATERASRADDILANAKVVNSIEAAVAESQIIIGTSARARSLPSKLTTPREISEKLVGLPEDTKVSVLFGTERSGLTNEEMSLCHYHCYIPTNPDYSSLNLASAVQIMCYEIRQAFLGIGELPELKSSESGKLAEQDKVTGMLEHFKQVMQDTGYLVPEHAKHLDSRLNRLFAKAQVTQAEVNILRGFLSSIDKYQQKVVRELVDRN